MKFREKILRFLGRRPEVPPVGIALEQVIRTGDFIILQIGAHVGNTYNDPLFHGIASHADELRRRVPPAHRIVLVEPVEAAFEQLRRNYSSIPGVRFENVAIAETSGPRSFYRLGVDPEKCGYPEFLSQLGSLKRERMGVLWDNLENIRDYKQFYLKHLVIDTVPCLTFRELIERCALPRIDLLQIDAEGSEYDILASVPFDEFDIRFINYERVLLDGKKRDCEKLLKGWGYKLADHGQDTFCYKREDRRLAKFWRGSALT